MAGRLGKWARCISFVGAPISGVIYTFELAHKFRVSDSTHGVIEASSILAFTFFVAIAAAPAEKRSNRELVEDVNEETLRWDAGNESQPDLVAQLLGLPDISGKRDFQGLHTCSVEPERLQRAAGSFLQQTAAWGLAAMRVTISELESADWKLEEVVAKRCGISKKRLLRTPRPINPAVVIVLQADRADLEANCRAAATAFCSTWPKAGVLVLVERRNVLPTTNTERLGQKMTLVSDPSQAPPDLRQILREPGGGYVEVGSVWVEAVSRIGGVRSSLGLAARAALGSLFGSLLLGVVWVVSRTARDPGARLTASSVLDTTPMVLVFVAPALIFLAVIAALVRPHHVQQIRSSFLRSLLWPGAHTLAACLLVGRYIGFNWPALVGFAGSTYLVLQFHTRIRRVLSEVRQRRLVCYSSIVWLLMPQVYGYTSEQFEAYSFRLSYKGELPFFGEIVANSAEWIAWTPTIVFVVYMIARARRVVLLTATLWIISTYAEMTSVDGIHAWVRIGGLAPYLYNCASAGALVTGWLLFIALSYRHKTFDASWPSRLVLGVVFYLATYRDSVRPTRQLIQTALTRSTFDYSSLTATDVGLVAANLTVLFVSLDVFGRKAKLGPVSALYLLCYWTSFTLREQTPIDSLRDRMIWCAGLVAIYVVRSKSWNDFPQAVGLWLLNYGWTVALSTLIAFEAAFVYDDFGPAQVGYPPVWSTIKFILTGTITKLPLTLAAMALCIWAAVRVARRFTPATHLSPLPRRTNPTSRMIGVVFVLLIASLLHPVSRRLSVHAITNCVLASILTLAILALFVRYFRAGMVDVLPLVVLITAVVVAQSLSVLFIGLLLILLGGGSRSLDRRMGKPTGASLRFGGAAGVLYAWLSYVFPGSTEEALSSIIFGVILAALCCVVHPVIGDVAWSVRYKNARRILKVCYWVSVFLGLMTALAISVDLSNMDAFEETQTVDATTVWLAGAASVIVLFTLLRFWVTSAWLQLGSYGVRRLIPVNSLSAQAGGVRRIWSALAR